MTEDLKKYLYSILLKLSAEEKREIISFLEDSSLESGRNLYNMVSEIRKNASAADTIAPVAVAAWW